MYVCVLVVFGCVLVVLKYKYGAFAHDVGCDLYTFFTGDREDAFYTVYNRNNTHTHTHTEWSFVLKEAH
jgi:hypothetical protein